MTEEFTNDILPEENPIETNNDTSPQCWCHLCNQLAIEDFYIEHLQIHHPTTLFVLFATNLSTERMSYINTLPFYINPEIYEDAAFIDDLFQNYDILSDENEDYENLLALCDYIGYHKLGIEDMTSISTITDKNLINNEDICPICIDSLKESEDDIYTLNKCNHSYCKECIVKWCSENKTCPMCKISLVE
jgi:hypothetical protein